jgi:ribosomal protein S18 acetylase RimI-like enzyme
MPEFTLRDAEPKDARAIVSMVRLMMVDLASYGGHAPAHDNASWDKLTDEIAKDLGDLRWKFIVALSREGEWLGIVGGKLVTLGGAFAPKETLHISVVYVTAQFRRAGIARTLIDALLDWGRACGSAECDLSVLERNPAKALYEKLGFAPREVKMALPLRAGPRDSRIP